MSRREDIIGLQVIASGMEHKGDQSHVYLSSGYEDDDHQELIGALTIDVVDPDLRKEITRLVYHRLNWVQKNLEPPKIIQNDPGLAFNNDLYKLLLKYASQPGFDARDVIVAYVTNLEIISNDAEQEFRVFILKAVRHLIERIEKDVTEAVLKAAQDRPKGA